MRRRASGVIRSIVAAITVLGMGAAANAQDIGGPFATFRFEVSPRISAGAPAVEGWVYNDGLYRITNVRLKIEVLDGNGAVVEQVMGWVMGDIAAGSRGYFVIPMAATASSHRVTVLSFDVVSRGA